jgi:hypothetical protein
MTRSTCKIDRFRAVGESAPRKSYDRLNEVVSNTSHHRAICRRFETPASRAPQREGRGLDHRPISPPLALRRKSP